MNERLQPQNKFQQPGYGVAASPCLINIRGVRLFGIGIFFLYLLSCNTARQEEKLEKFDQNKWMTKQGDDYPYRDKMLDDFIEHYKRPGAKKDSLVSLLGAPDRRDSSYFFYRIAQERLGIVTLHTKTLVVKFAADSTVEWVKIHE
jgi:hypothetical protein